MGGYLRGSSGWSRLITKSSEELLLLAEADQDLEYCVSLRLSGSDSDLSEGMSFRARGPTNHLGHLRFSGEEM